MDQPAALGWGRGGGQHSRAKFRLSPQGPALSNCRPWSWGQEASPPARSAWGTFSRGGGLGRLDLTGFKSPSSSQLQPGASDAGPSGALPTGSLRSHWVDARPPGHPATGQGHPAKQTGAGKQEVWPSWSAGPGAGVQRCPRLGSLGDWSTFLSDKAGTAGQGSLASDC